MFRLLQVLLQVLQPVPVLLVLPLLPLLLLEQSALLHLQLHLQLMGKENHMFL